MSADPTDGGGDPPGLEGGGDADCYTNFFVVSIETPEGVPAESLTFDGEVVSDRPLTLEQLGLAALQQTQPWVDALLDSPRFRERFGNNPTITIIISGIIRGC